MTHVTDHAVCRYLECVYGVDIEAIRAEMNTPAVALAIEFGCGAVKRADGSRLVLNGECVQTVLPASRKPDRRRRTPGDAPRHG